MCFSLKFSSVARMLLLDAKTTSLCAQRGRPARTRELEAVDALATRPVAVREVSALEHEVGDHSVEDAALAALTQTEGKWLRVSEGRPNYLFALLLSNNHPRGATH